MDIFFAEAKSKLDSKDIKFILDTKQKLDVLSTCIEAHVKLIHTLSMQTKTLYVQRALKHKK